MLLCLELIVEYPLGVFTVLRVINQSTKCCGVSFNSVIVLSIMLGLWYNTVGICMNVILCVFCKPICTDSLGLHDFDVLLNDNFTCHALDKIPQSSCSQMPTKRAKMLRCHCGRLRIITHRLQSLNFTISK